MNDPSKSVKYNCPIRVLHWGRIRMKFRVLAEKVEKASPKWPGCCPPNLYCIPGVPGPTIGAM